MTGIVTSPSVPFETPLQAYIREHEAARVQAKDYLDYLALGGSTSMREPPLSKKPAVSVDPNLDRPQLLKELEKLKRSIGYYAATPTSKRFWDNFESDKQRCLHVVLQFAESLQIRGLTVNDCSLAYSRSEAKTIKSILDYVDFQRTKKKMEELAAGSTDLSADHRAYLLIPKEWHLPLFKDANGFEYSGQNVGELYRRVCNKVGRDDLENRAQVLGYWEDLEAKFSNHPIVLLRLAQELAIREATIPKFFLAYIYSNSDNLSAVLSYFDYSRAIGK